MIGGRGPRAVVCAFVWRGTADKVEAEAETELKKAEEGWQQAMADLNQKLEETSQEFKLFVEQSKAEDTKFETELTAQKDEKLCDIGIKDYLSAQFPQLCLV